MFIEIVPIINLLIHLRVLESNTVKGETHGHKVSDVVRDSSQTSHQTCCSENAISKKENLPIVVKKNWGRLSLVYIFQTIWVETFMLFLYFFLNLNAVYLNFVS
jgi:hypothetical protein